MNFVAVTIVSVIVLGHPLNKRGSRLLIGLNRILLCSRAMFWPIAVSIASFSPKSVKFLSQIDILVGIFYLSCINLVKKVV